MRGVNTLTAIGLCAEVGDWARFPRPAQVMSYLGLVPSEQSSGEQRRQGTITKSGSQHGRRLLVEAAWHYRRDPTSAHRCGAARPDNPPTSSRSRGRGSGAAIAPGSACTHSAERTPPWSTSPSRASLPASAGPSPPPTNPRRHPHGGRGGGPRQHHAPGHPRSRYGQPPQAATPDPRQRALRRNPVLGPPESPHDRLTAPRATAARSAARPAPSTGPQPRRSPRPLDNHHLHDSVQLHPVTSLGLVASAPTSLQGAPDEQPPQELHLSAAPGDRGRGSRSGTGSVRLDEDAFPAPQRPRRRRAGIPVEVRGEDHLAGARPPRHWARIS
jgi:hypothetical protein